MNHINSKVNISVKNQTYSFFYSYKPETTFLDLLEYFIFLYPNLDICLCYHFQIADSNPNNRFNISKIYKISDYYNFLNNLILFKYENGNKCNNQSEKYLLKRKFDIISDYESKLDNLRQQIASKNNYINQQFEKIKELEKNNALLIQGINGNLQIIENLNNIGVKIKNVENNRENITINKEGGLEVKQKDNDHKPNFINFYDVIVHIDSIKDINKGWRVEMSNNAEKNYEIFKNQKALKIGVIGNANKGKSFMLSKISKIKLPSGMTLKTEGLSIKYPDLKIFKDRKIVLLDSAGLETPVLVSDEKLDIDKKNELFKEKSREKLITELFLQNYIVNNSDILIVMVDALSFSEQKLLMKVKKEMERAKKVIPLYVIHNLKTYTTKKQVEDYIKETLLKSATFTLKEGHKISTGIYRSEGIYYYEDIEKDKDKSQKIFHLIYANEYSEAGKIYNQYTLNFIENSYQQIINLESFDVIETIKERYIKVSKDIVEKTEKDERVTKESFDGTDPKLIKLKSENEIILKKCLTDELGFSNFKANGFEPMYNIYKKDNKIIVRIEAPGNCNVTSNLEYTGEYNIIKLKGEKKKDKEPENLDMNIYNLRENGKFTLEIPLKISEYHLSNKAPKIEYVRGVFIIEYDVEKDETGGVCNPELPEI